jgi:hypothetical protein
MWPVVVSLAKTLQMGADRAFEKDPVTCWLALLAVIGILVFSGMAFRYLYKTRRERNRTRRETLKTIRELTPGSQAIVLRSRLWQGLLRSDE